MTSLPNGQHWLTPAWQPHPRVRACITTRLGHYSPAPWQGFNLGLNCGDVDSRVQVAREHVRQRLCLKQVGWLTQRHGTDLVASEAAPCEADASYSQQALHACAILTADCMPVLLARQDGSAVAAAHAGWRGMAAGILSRTLKQLAPQGEAVSAFLGPAICQGCYQVDEAVRDSFIAKAATSAPAFAADGPGHYRLSLATAARLELEAQGVAVTASGLCTRCDNDHFYSYRGEGGHTGRFASLVWLA